jgi:hypothetical protein
MHTVQRLCCASLIACLALGCASSREPNDRSMMDSGGSGGGRPAGDGGQGGSGAVGGIAGTAGTSGAGGTGGTGGWPSTGGAGGNTPMMCTRFAPAEIYGCVPGDYWVAGDQRWATAELTGVVEPLTADGHTCRDRALVDLGNFGAPAQSYRIVGEGAELELTLGVPSGARAVLEAGQTVTVSFFIAYPFSTPVAGNLLVQDEAGKVLYWLTQSSSGPSELALPPGVAVELGAYRCTSESECGSTDWGGSLVVRDDFGEIELEYGEREDIGAYTVIAVSNSMFESNGTCIETDSSHTVALAFLPRGFLTPCYGLSESACSSIAACKPVHAYFEPEASSPSFVACVEQDSCGGGDAVTCAHKLGTDEVAAFTTTCVPPGWMAYDDSDCLRGDEAGAP